ncbi:MAG: hypothetical protein JRJ85_11190, partial [Deltaproteobacteria bacterium]|nr:hypothetical protein [Deltaproteobacteria bacterium]
HEGAARRLFAEVIGHPVPCDVCHDAHFIYVFDTSGKILRFLPLQLTKYGNEPWDEEDVAKMKDRILGLSILQPMTFDPAVDAVSSATITSAVIFDSIFQGREIIEELKRKGMWKTK